VRRAQHVGLFHDDVEVLPERSGPAQLAKLLRIAGRPDDIDKFGLGDDVSFFLCSRRKAGSSFPPIRPSVRN